MADENRQIYSDGYDPVLLARRSDTPYDRAMIAVRDGLLEQHAVDRDLLDLCCGIGEYAIPIAPVTRTTIGLDFSHTMLEVLKGRPDSGLVRVIEGDAQALPLPDDCIDVVASFAALYYVPSLDQVLGEVARVLRRGGVAILEIGNRWSLNTLVAESQHRHAGWAKPHHVSHRTIRQGLAAHGLVVESWRAFQLLPMFGAPRRLAWLLPLLSARWKRVLGVRARGVLLDEWLSSARPLRYVAFRQLIVVRRR